MLFFEGTPFLADLWRGTPKARLPFGRPLKKSPPPQIICPPMYGTSQRGFLVEHGDGFVCILNMEAAIRRNPSALRHPGAGGHPGLQTGALSPEREFWCSSGFLLQRPIRLPQNRAFWIALMFPQQVGWEPWKLKPIKNPGI